jgi:hypothetical protein
MNLNPELLMAILPGTTGILFALGGTQISDKQGGIKWLRRIGITLAVGVATAFIAHWIQALLAAAATFGLLSMSRYGSSHSWLERAITALCFGLIGAVCGLSLWNLFTVLGFLAMFMLSNSNMTRILFIWKIVEFATGALIGIQVAYSLMGFGWTWLR